MALIEVLEQAYGVSKDLSVVVDLNMPADRCLRMDGSLPVPTDHSRLFVPSAGRFVSNSQFLLSVDGKLLDQWDAAQVLRGAGNRHAAQVLQLKFGSTGGCCSSSAKRWRRIPVVHAGPHGY